MTEVDTGAEGERRQVTAVFVDLENFSALASEADAEDLQSWLDDYYRQTRLLFEAGGGTITEYLGDGVVAVFGLSRSMELSADLAVDAALRAVQSIRLSYQNRGMVRLRAGVATGEVVVRSAADRQGLPRLTGTVTTLAQRIQSVAAPGSVVIADDTRALLRGRFETRELPDTALKGFAERQRLYEVTARLPAAGIDPPEQFVGRAREMARVFAADGPMLVVGQPGVGKTAFVAHLASQFAAKSVLQGDAISRGSSYQPFRDWLLDQMAPDDPDFAALARHLPDLTEAERQAIALILGLPEGQSLLLSMSSLALKNLIEGAFCHAIFARQARGLLLFEDLHWFDVASFGVLGRLIADPAAAQYRIILTSREDAKLGQYLNDPSVRTLGLDPLPVEDARVLLDRLAPGPMEGETRALILDRAGGVPLFLHQLARRSGRVEAGLPATLMDLLGERIDAMADAKPVLQRAAALGRSFGTDILRALDPEEADPVPHLRAAARAGVLVARPNRRFEFAHALMAQAAYQSMLRRSREALHARIAELLTTQFPEILQREPGLLADHQQKARLTLPAIFSYLGASQRLLLQGAFVDAETMAKAALSLCPDLPADQRSELEIACHTAIGSILMQVQGFTADPVRRSFDAVLDIASAQPRLGAQTAPALFGSFSHAIIAGDDQKAVRFCHLLEDMASEAPDTAEGVEIRLAALAARNCASFYQGNFADQFTRIAAIRPLYRTDLHAGMIARYGMDIFAAAQMFETPARAICGQIDKVPALIAETDWHQTVLSIPAMQPYALVWGAVPLFYAGHLSAALERLSRGIAVAETQGAVFWQIIGQTWSFVMDPTLSISQAGLAAFGQLIETQRAIGANVGVPYFAAVYSARLAAAGRHEDAWLVSTQAVAEGRASGLYCWFAEVLRLHARNCRATRRFGEGDAALAQSVDLATRQGAGLWLIRALLDQAETGRPVTGLAEALAMFPDGATLPEIVGARDLLVGSAAPAK